MEDTAPNFHAGPPGFAPTDPNPFAADGRYGPQWRAFIIVDDKGAGRPLGHGVNGLFHYGVWSEAADLLSRLADFLRYEWGQDHEAIVAGLGHLDLEQLVAKALEETPAANQLRPRDPPFLVHSTTATAAAKIARDGELRSAAQLRREGYLSGPRLGQTALAEPPEFADLVNFARWTSPWPEAVTASNQKNRGVSLDEPYEPGARFYFGTARIAAASLLVRTGSAIFAVRHGLPLAAYLVGQVNATDLAADTPPSGWTPRQFSRRANEFFARRSGRESR